ncbi:SusC/RagA family TonB-linked outer membrane protein [Galbibacter sp.]|uniref:SusC/RagA family TonB-linked outer membrane protein n=1 Tax=Galbibacter sp. TaxID=2918471 RepID=UPI003A908B49
MRKRLLFFTMLSWLLCSVQLNAQDKAITGTVSSLSDGLPLPGATIAIKGTNLGTSSDFDGNFALDAVSEQAVLVISMIGFTTQEVAVEGRNSFSIELSADTQQLDEVVVTSLGLTRKRKSLGYSVTELDGESVSLVKESNVASSLAGKVAGVVVSKSTSGVGGGTRVVIRGNNSITGNNQPLYVIDGVPIDNTALQSSNGSEYSVPDMGNGISDINPDDIASMSILKGPNAAALYGSRASNGVIIITTKRGRNTKGLGISYTSSVTFDSPLVLPKYQNQYGRGTDGNFPLIDTSADLNTQVSTVKGRSSWGPRFDGSMRLGYNGEMRPYVAQPNNVKDFFETGSSYVNNISLTAGSDKATVFFSYTNSDLESILPNSSVKRNNFNLRGTANLSDKLSLDAKVTYFKQEANNRPAQGTEGVVAYVWPLVRNVSINDLKTYQNLDNPLDPTSPYAVIAPTSNGGNPYWMLHNDHNADFRTRITGFAKLNYQFTDWLSAFARVGTDAVMVETEGYEATGHHFFYDGRIRFGQNDITETNYDFLLMFNKDIGSKFNISANAGGNMRHSTYKESGTNGFDFKIPGRYFLDNTDGSQLTASQSAKTEKRVNSLYGSASFSYNDMVYLDVTARNDWSSTLPVENQSYFYSSASLSVLLNEIFNLDEANIDLLKLKASTASVGNDTKPQQIINVFKVAANGYLENTQITRQNIKFSESLRPEDVTSHEVGLELQAFRNRLYADFAYYEISSKDLIFDVPVDPGTGYGYFRENVGEITNKGFELLVGGTPVDSENFSWDVSINIAKNENKLVSLIDGQDNYFFSSSNSGIVDVRAEVGGGYGDIYVRDWLRNEAGQLILTSEGRPQATAERVKVGNYQPDMTGGFTNTFRYKDFTLNALVDFRIGGEVFSATDAGLDASGVSENSLRYREDGVLVEGVIDDGEGNFTPNTTQISAQDYWGAVSGIGSEYVFSQTNFRLRELSLTYNLPKRFLDRSFFTDLSLSAVGRNLFFFYKKADNFDPESTYSTSTRGQGVLYYALPTTKSIGLSLNVKF